MNLYEQFSRFMNRYFLIIAILQLFPTLTPVSPVTTWVPLALIFAISAIKEAYDDYKRYLEDKRANERQYEILKNDRFSQIQSQHIQVGDILKIKENEEFPADLVLISSSDSKGCFVQTANLDGETDLKSKSCLPVLQNLTDSELNRLSGAIQCSHPNRHIYSFDANLQLQNDSSKHSLNYKQLLLQGTFLRNTDYVYGCVVYTGKQTKLGMNKQQAAPKFTYLDSQIDRISRFIFVFQLFLVLILGIVGNILSDKNFLSHHFYLELESQSNAWYQFFVIPLRMLLLLSFMIPISLKVTLDITKMAAASFINSDLEMYDEETDEPAHAANTAIAEDLGQIQYIFTDKTGTLTENVMIFKQCSIDGTVYGFGDVPFYQDPALLAEVEGLSRIKENASTSSSKISNLFNFFSCLAICHEVSPLLKKTQDGSIAQTLQFKGSSPDEEALVGCTAKIGIVFKGKNEHIVVDYFGRIKKYTLLNILEFTSDRKRMSILVRDTETNEIHLFIKGADDVLIPRCNLSSKNDYDLKNLELFGSLGLRTLVVAGKSVSPEFYEDWKLKYEQANNNIENREQLLQSTFDLLETDLNLFGITAIEDKLQYQVPETIEMLEKAGIKIWILTGDKKSTAIQIAHSCNLIKEDANSRLFHLEGDDLNEPEFEQKLVDLKSDIINWGRSGRPASQSSILSLHSSLNKKKVNLIVTGSTLKKIIPNEYFKRLFLEIALICNSVICCRVTPYQKASVVEMVKSKHYRTLSIGDGGNDVAMIQKAHIGVGIKGKEGFQAARAADYHIGKFRFLQRLILIHGRYSYKRTSFIAIYCFFKSIYIGILQLLFEFLCGFSGTSLLNSFSLSTYNVLFTSFPIIFYCLDKDLLEQMVFKHPKVYKENLNNQSFNIRLFGSWFLQAFFFATMTIAFGLTFMNDENATPYGILGFDAFSMAIYTCAIFIQTATMLFESNYLTIFNQIAIWSSIILYLFLAYIANLFPFIDFYGVISELYGSGDFWFSVIFITLITSLPVFIIHYVHSNYFPSFSQILRFYQYHTEEYHSSFELRFSSNDSLRAKRKERTLTGDTFASKNSNAPLIK